MSKRKIRHRSRPMTGKARKLQAVLRSDLNAFTKKVFQEINPGAQFFENWHLKTIAWHLQKCAEGKKKRLIITVPPRHLKSIYTSVALPALLLGQDPTRNIVCVSYSTH